jgi:hypothetical protein
VASPTTSENIVRKELALHAKIIQEANIRLTP